MDSVSYLKRKYELTKEVPFLLIAEELEQLKKQIGTLTENQCKCFTDPREGTM